MRKTQLNERTNQNEIEYTVTFSLKQTGPNGDIEADLVFDPVPSDLSESVAAYDAMSDLVKAWFYSIGMINENGEVQHPENVQVNIIPSSTGKTLN